MALRRLRDRNRYAGAARASHRQEDIRLSLSQLGDEHFMLSSFVLMPLDVSLNFLSGSAVINGNGSRTAWSVVHSG
jgi:hypothetical protein